MSGNRGLRHILLGLILSATAACSTAPPSIFQPFDLDRGNSLSTDASQRVIINMKTHASSRPGRVNPERIVCAEPSPDVASVVASSFGFGLNVLGKANTAFSGSQGNALAQLAERTITVQLLRDQMYQACQAYANGAISGTEYSLLMSRNNDAMVTLMLGESAARLVGRDLATASAAGGANATASMPDIVKAVTEAAKKQDEASQASKEAVAATENKGNADAAAQGVTSDSSDTAADNAGENADKAGDKKVEKVKQSEKKNEDAKEALEKAASVVTGASTYTETNAGGFRGSLPELNEYAVGVAEQLVELQENYFGQGSTSHFIAACTVALGNVSARFGIKQTGTMSTLTIGEIAEDMKPGQIKTDSAEERPEYFYSPGKSYSIDGYAASAYDRAEFAEQEKGILGRWGRGQITSDRLRTLVALEDRDRASALAMICSEILYENLMDDRRANDRKAFLNFLVDLEREKSKQYKSMNLPTTSQKPRLAPSQTVTSELVASYVRCDTEVNPADTEACRIEVLAQVAQSVADEISISEPGVDPMSGTHIVQIAQYNSQPLLEENWPKVAAAIGTDLMKDKARHIKKVKVANADKFNLRVGPFKDKAAADAFCAKAKSELAKIGGGCIPEPK